MLHPCFLPLLVWSAVFTRHTVMFGFTPETKDEEIAAIKGALLDLPKKIPGILTYQLGEDLRLPSGQNKQIGVNRRIVWSATFANADMYEQYRTHPAHIQFLQLLKPVVLSNSRAAIQFETDDAIWVVQRQRNLLLGVAVVLAALLVRLLFSMQ